MSMSKEKSKQLPELVIEQGEFVALAPTLEEWYDKLLGELPSVLRERIKSAFQSSLFSSFMWDAASEDERRREVKEWDYEKDPANLPARQAAKYQLHAAAAMVGLTALEAAHFMLMGKGTSLGLSGISPTAIDELPLTRRLLTLDELRTYGAEGPFHPLAEWLRRAREEKIAYMPGLDYAVAQRMGVTSGVVVTMTTTTSDTDQDDEGEQKQFEPMLVPEICDLFDAISQAEIAAMFEKVTQWESYFERAARNGLIDARQGDVRPWQYNPAKVADWLVRKGHYARDYADRRLANNLPKRSKDEKYLITGEIEQSATSPPLFDS